jgi:hypothetical protein
VQDSSGHAIHMDVSLVSPQRVRTAHILSYSLGGVPASETETYPQSIPVSFAHRMQNTGVAIAWQSAVRPPKKDGP